MPQNPNLRLQAIFNFTEEDLAANQEGRFSPTQLHLLQRETLAFIDPSLMETGLVTAFFGIIVTGCTGCYLIDTNTYLGGILLLCCLSLVGIMSYAGEKNTSPLSLDAKEPRLNVIVGKPYFKPPKSFGGEIYHEILVANWNLFLTKSQYEQFQSFILVNRDKDFAFFSLPHSKRVLSVSVVSLDPADFFTEA